jgi:hypothetical protein
MKGENVSVLNIIIIYILKIDVNIENKIIKYNYYFTFNNYNLTKMRNIIGNVIISSF